MNRILRLQDKSVRGISLNPGRISYQDLFPFNPFLQGTIGMSVESQLMIIFHQMKGVEETELIQRLKNGDEVAFRTIVETWKDMVYNTVLGILQDATEAEDVTQDVFVQVFESIGQFKGDAKFSTWLYRIAVTKSLDQLRRKKRKKRFAFLQSLFGVNEEEVRHDPGFFHPGVALENKERSAELFRAINKLPENQKTAFLLHKVEGLSYQEVADVMETTVPSVESLMHRAKGNLRKSLARFYENQG